jgi:hypothetical protein
VLTLAKDSLTILYGEIKPPISKIAVKLWLNQELQAGNAKNARRTARQIGG